MRRVPAEIASAMLAGVLLDFGLGIFTRIGDQPALVLAMCAAYLLGKRWAPRYAVLAVMAVGLGVAAAAGQLRLDGIDWQLTEFVWTTPAFSWSAAISVGRSEEHTSELQSLMRISYAVFCLKKKKKMINNKI